MDLTSGQPFWPIQSGILQTFPPLCDDATCDVAVVGGGITGALVAYELVNAGVDALLLDRRDVAMGSTAASTGLLSYENDVPLSRLIRQVGEKNAVRSYQVSLEAVRAFRPLVKAVGGDCGFARRESFYLATSARDLPGLRAEFAARRRHGFEVEWWSRSEIAAASSLPHQGGILTRDAAQVDTYRLTKAVLARAQSKGLRIYDRTAVTRIRPTSRGVELSTSRRARVRARKVVMATGHETLAKLRSTATALHSTYAVVSEPLASFNGWPKQRLIWETARPYRYVRVTDDGRALIGGFDEPFYNPQRRDRLLPAKAQFLAKTFSRLFPRIDFEVAYAWTGTFAETPDGLPYIGAHPDHPRMFFALGYGGNGITWGLIAAKIITDLHLGRKNADAAIFGFERP